MLIQITIRETALHKLIEKIHPTPSDESIDKKGATPSRQFNNVVLPQKSATASHNLMTPTLCLCITLYAQKRQSFEQTTNYNNMFL